MSSADDFFAGGNPSARFPTVGSFIVGEITRVGERMQQRDFTTGEPKFYKGTTDPIWQLPIDVQTDQRDAEIANDTGVRTVYVKGQMQKAFRTALRQAGVSGPRVGGRLKVTYTNDGVVERGIAPKQFEVLYQPPAAQADDYFTKADSAAAVPAQAQSVAPQPETAGVGQRPW